MIELPNYYACTGCGETFNFASRDAFYCFSRQALSPDTKLAGVDLLSVPARPGWCSDCGTVCLVENIEPLRAFELAFGAVKAGKQIEYPVSTEHMDRQAALDATESFLRWRIERHRPARALCCGRTNYQLLDVAQPLLKHQECDFGVVEPRYVFSAYNGPGPGVYTAANVPVYTGEGRLIGLLTRRNRGSDIWDVIPAEYPAYEEN
jgi:hypothetical protein